MMTIFTVLLVFLLVGVVWSAMVIIDARIRHL